MTSTQHHYNCAMCGQCELCSAVIQRRGIAAVEFAIVLPVLVLLLLGAMEAGRGIMGTHSLQEAAVAGCRVYSVQDTTLAQARSLIDLAMLRAGITDYTIEFDPASKSAINADMEPVSVTVSAPYGNVAWLPPTFLSGTIMQGKCVMPADMHQSDGGDSNGHSMSNDDNSLDGFVRHEEAGPPDDDDD